LKLLETTLLAADAATFAAVAIPLDVVPPLVVVVVPAGVTLAVGDEATVPVDIE
jgi:hypothetical protein